MKKFLPVFFILFFNFLAAQNLVPNGSFEEYLECPTAFDQVNNCIGWTSVSSSPDYLNTCSSSAEVSIPNNFAGYQNPFSGYAYCGIHTYCSIGLCLNYRELIQAQLNNALIIGTEYFISMYVVAALNNSHKIDLATNKFGIRFSTIPYSLTNPPPINNWAHYYSDSIISDTVNWIHLQGSFVTDSSYQFIMIGNFFDDEHTSINKIGADSSRAYYYVDNVCVSTSAETCLKTDDVINLSNSEFFKAYPNPCNNILNIGFPSTVRYSLLITNTVGKPVYEYLNDSQKNNLQIDINKFPEGIYFLMVIEGEHTFSKSILVHH